MTFTFIFYNSFFHNSCFSLTRNLATSRTSHRRKATNFQHLGPTATIKMILKISTFQANLMNPINNAIMVNYGRIVSWVVLLESVSSMRFPSTMREIVMCKLSWSGKTITIKNSSFWIYQTYFRRETPMTKNNNNTILSISKIFSFNTRVKILMHKMGLVGLKLKNDNFKTFIIKFSISFHTLSWK